MAFVAKLMNPTPWNAELQYDRGIVLVVESFGSLDLQMNQMDDFRPDKPGSEAVQEETDMFGLFLLDSDRPYDNQALEALNKCRKKKTDLYNEVTQNARNRAARQNIDINDETFLRVMDQMGMNTLKAQIDQLTELIEEFEEVVKPESGQSKALNLDPSRTVFALPKPREFPSVASREFFLKKNPEIAQKEKEYRKRLEDAQNQEVV